MGLVMSGTVTVPSSGVSRPVVAATATILAVLLLGTLGLWAAYGTAVFYEIIAAGMALCL